MKDIELARKTLEDEKLTLCVVRKGAVIYKSSKRGIFPLYNAIVNEKLDLKNASAADKVVGKAAALLYDQAGLKEIYCNLISERVLNLNLSTKFHYEESCPFIMNRDKTGSCPVEARVQYISDYSENIEAIKSFLTEIGIISK